MWGLLVLCVRLACWLGSQTTGSGSGIGVPAMTKITLKNERSGRLSITWYRKHEVMLHF